MTHAGRRDWLSVVAGGSQLGQLWDRTGRGTSRPCGMGFVDYASAGDRRDVSHAVGHRQPEVGREGRLRRQLVVFAPFVGVPNTGPASDGLPRLRSVK
jgi:hypothetical protein